MSVTNSAPDTIPEPPKPDGSRNRVIALLAGAALFCVMLAVPPPEGLSQAGWRVAAVALVMALWWLTEALPVAATALLPIVLLPLLGIEPIKKVTANYANPLIFLFMGGFMLAMALQRWNLHRRIALRVLKAFGTRPTMLVAGFMLATAGLSMWISNTATTVMMVPIAVSVLALLNDDKVAHMDAGDEKNFHVALMLGIAYAASIGGISTIVGTPPNAFLVGFVGESIAEEHRMEIGFARWLVVGLPVTLVMLPVTWVLLTRFLFPLHTPQVKGGKELIEVEIAKLGIMKRGEWITLIIFGLTGLFWILRPFITDFSFNAGGREWMPFAGLSDTVIAMIAAGLLFSIPANPTKREFTMDWKTTSKLPWDILILFGGGMSLANAVKETGVAEFIGSQATFFAGVPTPILVLIITTAVIFLTELTSNIATTATLLPILAALAPGLGVDPYLLIIPATIAASCAFMMPVATPPNAIVFGSRQISLPQMMRAGIWLNLAGIIIIPVVISLTLRFLVD